MGLRVRKCETVGILLICYTSTMSLDTIAETKLVHAAMTFRKLLLCSPASSTSFALRLIAT